jgi:hypothetical protein
MGLIMEDKNTVYIDVPFTVICKDADDKPLAIDEDKWIEDNKMYTVTDVKQDLIDAENGCYILLEVKPNGGYEGFLSDRFEICTEINPN